MTLTNFTLRQNSGELFYNGTQLESTYSLRKQNTNTTPHENQLKPFYAEKSHKFH